MQLKQTIYAQFRKPSGTLGKWVGRSMAFKNNERSRWTLEQLNFNPTDYLLEIGYGPGVSLNKIAQQLTSGFIGGIDHSEVMLKQATQRNRKWILQHKMNLECGTIWDLNYASNFFDVIFGSNVHFFWDDPVFEFQKLVQFLKPGGRLIMVFQPRWAKSEIEIKQISGQTREMFQKAGLKNIEINFKPMSPVTCISITGRKTQG